MSQKHKGSCHCGKVSYEVDLDLNQKVLSCNCSICQRKGTLLAFVPDSQFELLSGKDFLVDYQFGKKVIHHYFCSGCGVTSFAAGQLPDGTPIKAINVRCIEAVNIESLDIQKHDGKSI